MKTLHYVSALAALFFISSCTERVLSPDKLAVTEIPDFIPTLQSGTYWIYERTHLDSNGTALSYPKTFDSLYVIGINNDRTSHMGLPVIELHDSYTYYSENGIPTMKRDTIYWVFDNNTWYVKNTNLSDSVCLCKKSLNNWRVYLHSSKDFTPGSDDGIWTKDSLWEENISSLYTTLIFNRFANRYKPYNYENVDVADNMYKSLQGESEIHFRKEILKPEAGIFPLSNKKHITISDIRTVWCNGGIGFVREKSLQKANYPAGINVVGASYDRKLIRFLIKSK